MDDFHLFQVVIFGSGFKPLLLSLVGRTTARAAATFAPYCFGILTFVGWSLSASPLGGLIATGLGRPVELLCDVFIFLIVA